MASRMRLLPRSMKLEKSSRTSDLLWRMCLHFSLVTLLIVGFNVPQSADIVALGNGLGHVKAGIKAAADAVVIFPSFSGMSFSL